MQELSGLREFLAVARLKSFSAAGRELGVTAAAMSQKVKQLEARLRVVLFQRTTRQVALTEAGESLFRRLGPALAEVDDALTGLSLYRGRPSGTLRLTAPRLCAEWLAPPLLALLSERYPELTVDVSLDDAFVDLVERGFDAGFRLGDAVEKDMRRVRVTASSGWAIVGAPSYLNAAGRPKRLEELVNHRAIRQRLIRSGQVYRWELERSGKPVTVAVSGTVIVDDVPLLISLAKRGVGLAYVPREQIAEELESGELEPVLEQHVTPGPGFCLYYPAGSEQQPKVRALIDTVKELRNELDT